MKLIPKNWSEFQQYKDRKPQWIKLHRELLNDFAYSSVHINTKAVLPLLWLLACEYDDGIIDASIEEIAFRIHIDENTVKKAVEELIERKFFTSVQECTELYKSVPREEKRREEIEGENNKEQIDYKNILEVFNFYADKYNLSKIREITGKRKNKLLSRFKENQNFKEILNEAFIKIGQSSFLLGKNNRSWKVDFDWLIENDTNIIKICEDKYKDGNESAGEWK